MVEINQLRQLVGIVECGTISKASAKLHLSQPALSRSMQRLENDLGVELFDHYANKVVLNESGELAVVYAKKILQELEEMTQQVKAFHQQVHSIRLASCAPAPLWDIDSLIKEIYPQIETAMTVVEKKELLQTLKAHRYDFILAPFAVNDDEVISYPYVKEDLYFSLPQSHPLAGEKELSFKAMEKETMLLYSQIGFWYDMHQRTMPNTKFLFQNERFAFNEIVKNSSLPSFTSNLSMKREGKMEGRVAIPIVDEEAHVTFYLTLLRKNMTKFQFLIERIENDDSF